MNDNNITEKLKFPGYTEWNTKEEQKRIAKKQERAEKATAQQMARDKKRRNSLPPFLMVRSGLLNQWVWTLIAAAALIGFWVNEDKLKHPTLVYGGVALLVYFTFGWGVYSYPIIKMSLKEDIWEIRTATSRYLQEPDYQLDLTDKINNKKLSRILIQHISKYDSGLFDKMLMNPESVTDINVAQNIILGHIKKKPVDVKKILDTFDIETMPKQLQRRLKRYAVNLHNANSR